MGRFALWFFPVWGTMEVIVAVPGKSHNCETETQHRCDDLTEGGKPMVQVDAATSLTLQLKQVELALRRTLEPLLIAEDILFEHWQVLAALLEQPGLRMTELAEASVLPAATLTRHVDRLVERALVIRRIDPDDKRRAVVALSSRGEHLARRLREVDSDVGIAAAAGAVVPIQG
jgi:DNA-binding MarR family transcriptional regulator